MNAKRRNEGVSDILQVNDDNFEDEIIKSELPSLIDRNQLFA